MTLEQFGEFVDRVRRLQFAPKESCRRIQEAEFIVLRIEENALPLHGNRFNRGISAVTSFHICPFGVEFHNQLQRRDHFDADLELKVAQRE